MVFTAGSATVFMAVFTVVWALDTGVVEEADIVSQAEALRALMAERGDLLSFVVKLEYLAEFVELVDKRRSQIG